MRLCLLWTVNVTLQEIDGFEWTLHDAADEHFSRTQLDNNYFSFCVRVRSVIALKMPKSVSFLTRTKTTCPVLQTKKQDCSREGQQQKEMGNVKERQKETAYNLRDLLDRRPIQPLHL